MDDEVMTDPNLELLLMLARHAWERMTPVERKELLHKQVEGWIQSEAKYPEGYAKNYRERE